MNIIANIGGKPGILAEKIAVQTIAVIGGILSITLGREARANVQVNGELTGNINVAITRNYLANPLRWNLLVNVAPGAALTFPAGCQLPNALAEVSGQVWTAINAGTYLFQFIRSSAGYQVQAIGINRAVSTNLFYLNGQPIADMSAPVVLAAGVNTITSDAGTVGTLSGAVSGNTAYRYYRVTMDQTNGDASGWAQVAEWGFFDGNGTRVLARAVTDGKNIYTPEPFPERANDAVQTTRWVGSTAATVPAYNSCTNKTPDGRTSAVFDFGTPQTFASCRYQSTISTYLTRSPRGWTVEGSNDKAAWSLLNSTSNYTPPVTQYTWTGNIALAYPTSLSISIDATATLTLAGDNTLDVGTTINSGTVRPTSATALGTGAVTLAGGVLDYMPLLYGARPGNTIIYTGGTLRRAADVGDYARVFDYAADGLDIGTPTIIPDLSGNGRGLTVSGGVLIIQNGGKNFISADGVEGSRARWVGAQFQPSSRWLLVGIATWYNWIPPGGGGRLMSLNSDTLANESVRAGARMWRQAGSNSANSVFGSLAQNIGVPNSSDGLLHIHSAYVVDGNGTLRKDGGVAQSVGAQNALGPIGVVTLFDDSSTNAGGNGKVDLRRMIMIDVGASGDAATTTAQLEAILAWADGVNSLLADAHAYKAAPPVATIIGGGLTTII